MKIPRTHGSWRAPERRALRPEPWLLGAALVAILLAEVWQSSQMAALSLELDRTQKAFVKTDAQRGFLRARLERETTLAELVSMAPRLGLERADVDQVRALPTEFLVADGSARDAAADPRWAWAERVSRLVVPEARARSRTGN